MYYVLFSIALSNYVFTDASITAGTDETQYSFFYIRFRDQDLVYNFPTILFITVHLQMIVVL